MYDYSKTIFVRVNGNQDHNQVEVFLGTKEFSLQQLEELIAEKLNVSAKNKKHWRLFTKAGLQLFDSDIMYLKDGDVIYVGLHGKEKAIKFINIHEYMLQANTIDEIYREAEALKKMKHTNIIGLDQAFIYKGQFVLILEFASGGELLHYVQDKGCLDQIEAHSIFNQITSAIRYCHGRGVVHRDLKLENVLFKDSTKAQIKIVDFGIAGSKKEKTDAGSILYMPPEVTSGANTTGNPAIDIWAMGIMLYTMVYGVMPFNGKTMDDIARKIEETEPPYPARQNKGEKNILTKQVRDLIKCLLKKDVADRISLNKIYIHDWMQLEAEEDIPRLRQEYEEDLKKKAEMKEQEEEKKFREEATKHIKSGSSGKKSIDLKKHGLGVKPTTSKYGSQSTLLKSTSSSKLAAPGALSPKGKWNSPLASPKKKMQPNKGGGFKKD